MTASLAILKKSPLLTVATLVWIVAILITCSMFSQIQTATRKHKANCSTLSTLAPEIARVTAYRDFISARIMAPLVTPTDLAALLSPRPTHMNKQASILPFSKLANQTVSLQWDSIAPENLAKAIQSLNDTPEKYELSSITLSASTQEGMMNAKANFSTISK